MPSDGTNNNVFSAEKSFTIKQDDRFFSRLMAKEISNGNTSSRILYYGEKSLAVPFLWEAQPGTPKHPLSQTSLPPLTPPPSYYSNKSNYCSKVRIRNHHSLSKANLLFSSILPIRFGRKATHVSPSSSNWSSSPSSTSLSTSISSRSLASPSFSMRDKDHDGEEGRVLSFSSSSSSSNTPLKHKCSNGFGGCYPFGNMKNATVSH